MYLLHAAATPMQAGQLLATLSTVTAVVQEAYDDGDYIISQGVHGSDFFVIEHGEVTATLKGDASDTAMKEASSINLLPVGNEQGFRGCSCLYALPGAGDEEASMSAAVGLRQSSPYR